MASFSAVHPSTRHPSLLSPSALTLPPSYSPSLFSLFHYGTEEMVQPWQLCQCNGTNIQYFSQLPPPITSTHPSAIIPIFILLCVFILLCFPHGSFPPFLSCYSSLQLARHLEGHSVCRLAAMLYLCTTSLHHVNLLLTLRKGLFTTHACFHATPM